ncbi:unnamed protein product [Musa banksii]
MFKYIISLFSLLPDALLSLLSKLRDNPRYQGQENLPHIVWVIAQASLGDRVVGMYLWAHYLLPVGSLSYSERAGSPGTKTRKQASQQLLPTAILAIQEKNLERTKEATDLFIWCFDSNLSSVTGSGWVVLVQTYSVITPLLCYLKQPSNCFSWSIVKEKLHLGNVDASIVVLHELSSEWKKKKCLANISPDSLIITLGNSRAIVTAPNTFFASGCFTNHLTYVLCCLDKLVLNMGFMELIIVTII